jgi:hypothetical protein
MSGLYTKESLLISLFQREKRLSLPGYFSPEANLQNGNILSSTVVYFPVFEL